MKALYRFSGAEASRCEAGFRAPLGYTCPATRQEPPIPTILVPPWPGPGKPSEQAVLQKFTDEGLEPYWWSNAPLDVYPPHDHPYHKVLYVLFGSITFGVGGQTLTLGPGDRLDLPPGIVHTAEVGEAGVVCLEARKEPPGQAASTQP
jgi:quercetin dioxygenase-like cupin family protein